MPLFAHSGKSSYHFCLILAVGWQTDTIKMYYVPAMWKVDMKIYLDHLYEWSYMRWILMGF